MIKQAEKIVKDFEKNPPIPTNKEDYRYHSELISLYLAAKKYLEKHT